jgi:glycolate oxidase
MGRISPNYIVQDGVIPRTKLPEVLREITRLSCEAGLRVANVFHAGDGNLHPLVLYDRRVEGQEHRAEALAAAILKLCVAAGGSITGEHGVGMEKRDFMCEMFAEPDSTRCAGSAAFDPRAMLQPRQDLPPPQLCAERAGPTTPPAGDGRRGGAVLTCRLDAPPETATPRPNRLTPRCWRAPAAAA